MALHQALKNLCFKSGWCYAVFWKLKRRSRMVLTWEDGYHEYQSSNSGGKLNCSESGGNPLVQGGTRHDASFSEGQIGLAVAKMSYCVYFLGEGIIGRVAFTGKHQWVFGDSDTNALGIAGGNAVNSRGMLEKYPSGWEAQFAAGIKTIVVIAVSQGVVQLGSTQMMVENLEWVEHVKSAFGTPPPSVPGAIVSDMASEGQGGKAAVIPSGMPVGSASTKLNKSSLNVLPSWGTGDSHRSGLQSLVHGCDGQTGIFPHHGLQTVPMAIEVVEPSQSSFKKTEQQHACDVDVRSTSLRPPVVNSCLHAFGAVSASSEADLGSSSNQSMSLQCEDLRNYQYGDYRNTQLRDGLVQCSTVDAFSRVPGLEADANVSMSSHEQSNNFAIPALSRVLESRSHKAPASIGEMNLQHPKGASTAVLAPFSFNAATNVKAGSFNGMVGNMGGVVAGKQGSVSSFGSKGHADPEFLVDSMVRDTPVIIPSLNECLKSHSKDPVSLSDGDVLDNLVPGGWDNFDTYLASVAQVKSNKWDCSFGIGDELSQALGPAFRQSNDKWEKTSKSLGMEQHKVVVEQQHTSGATCATSDISAVEVVSTWGSSFVKSEPYFPECKSEPLLDAVVASASSTYPSMSTTADDSFSCRTMSAIESEMSAPKPTNEVPFRHPRALSSQDCISQSFVHAGPIDCEASVNNNQARSKVFGDPSTFNMATSCSPLKAIINSWSEDMQSIRSDSTQTSQSKKTEELNKATRKRARPGESTRPRPKDRQQIQDRVRELREIVPNGSKCSIDALLEKTIKHMLFLQNVTIHAENLKKNGELKDDAESGASWALELGGEDTSGPPILVKNLSQPRQLLVEMFCEERGHFLEIADIIRSLGLTILKGVMESRSDKIWARFVVEANRDVRRVEILMSLVHHLPFKNSSSSSVTMASQTAPVRSQPGLDSSSSSQAQTLCGFQQSSLRA